MKDIPEIKKNGRRDMPRSRTAGKILALGFAFPILLLSGISRVEGGDVKISGYGQFRYTQSDSTIDGFTVKRLRAGLSGDILKNIRFKFQFETTKVPILLDAQVDIGLYPWLTLRIGQFKVPFSVENLISASDQDTINLSQPVEALCPGRDIGASGRDIGAALMANFSFIEGTFSLVNGSGINRADANDHKDVVGRIVVKPADFLRIGASLYDGETFLVPTYEPVQRGRTGLEVLLVDPSFSLRGEYISATDDTVKSDGWYVQGGYFLLPEKLQSIVKYDTLDRNKDISSNKSRRWTLGLNWFIAGKTKLQVNYEVEKREGAKTSSRAVLAQFQAAF